MITFDVKGYDKAGKLVEAKGYDTAKLHVLSGHWSIVRRMMDTVQKNKKVKEIKVFMAGTQYAWNQKALEWKAI
ncbi:hypothetical protein D3C86_1678010 [compost metagenome]